MRHSGWSFHQRAAVERARECDGASWQEKKAAYRALKRRQEEDRRAYLARQDAFAMDIGRAVLDVMAHRVIR